MLLHKTEKALLYSSRFSPLACATIACCWPTAIAVRLQAMYTACAQIAHLCAGLPHQPSALPLPRAPVGTKLRPKQPHPTTPVGNPAPLAATQYLSTPASGCLPAATRYWRSSFARPCAPPRTASACWM